MEIESNAYYIIDILRDSLFDGLKKAYVLKFDENTKIYQIPKRRNKKNKLTYSGKECCKDYL